MIDAVLDAWIASANRNEAACIDAWRVAVITEDALSYNEPPDWWTRESLGAALLRAKQFERAEQVFRDDLTRNPNNGRSLYGLWQTLRLTPHNGYSKEAIAALERQFNDAWAHADVMLRISDF